MGGSLHLYLSTLWSTRETPVIELAAELALRRRAELHTTIAAVEMAPFTHWGEPGVATAVLESVATDTRARAEQLAEAVRDLCGRMGIRPRITTLTALDSGARRPAQLARTHDLTLVGLAAADDDRRRAVEDLAFHSGRPVLAVPATWTRPLTFERAVVAWDHSEAAARALALALPFLDRSHQVEVVTVGAGGLEGPPAPGQAAADYLGRHGILAGTRILAPDRRTIGVQLMEAAAAERADVLVMGAYGKPRLQELIFGGVTRTALSDPQLPLLIAN